MTLAGLQPALFRTAVNALLYSPSYDALVTIAGSSALGVVGLENPTLPRTITMVATVAAAASYTT